MMLCYWCRCNVPSSKGFIVCFSLLSNRNHFVFLIAASVIYFPYYKIIYCSPHILCTLGNRIFSSPPLEVDPSLCVVGQPLDYEYYLDAASLWVGDWRVIAASGRRFDRQFAVALCGV